MDGWKRVCFCFFGRDAQALLCPTAARRSFDLAAHPEHVGTRFKTLTSLLASIPGQNCDYSYPDLPLTTLVDADAAAPGVGA